MDEPDPLTGRIIGCAIAVHRALGPGLLERTYETALCIELTDEGLSFDHQREVPVAYKGRSIGCYRPDLFIEQRVVVEVKAVERLNPVYEAQILAYMRALNAPVGLLLNFNTPVLKSGIHRFAL
jgi:GxxExxY protein